MNIKLYENIVMSASPNANLTIRRSHEHKHEMKKIHANNEGCILGLGILNV